MTTLRSLCLGWLWVGLAVVPAPGRGVPMAAEAPDPEALPTHITVVADRNFPPFLFVGADGQARGYLADVWKLFQAHTGIRVTLRPVNWSQAQALLASGRADVIDAAFKTPAREGMWDFLPAYGDALPISVYADQSVPGVHDLASLRGFTVAVQRSDACAEQLLTHGHQAVREYAYYADVVRAAAAGQVHLFCIDLATANYYLYLNSALKGFRPAFVFYRSRLHRAVRKGNRRMLEVVRNGMARITPAERAHLHARWLQHPSYAPWPWWHVVKLVVAVIVALLLALSLWLWFMRRAVRRRTGELLDARQRLQALFDASPDAMSVKDVHGVYQECNERQLASFGRTREEVLGRTDAELFQAGFVDTIVKADQAVVRSGKPYTYVLRTEQYAGGNRSMEVAKVPLVAANGAVVGILSVSRDITERARVEDALRLWAHAFENAAFGVVIFDVATRSITAANPTFAAQRGYTAEEMVGMSVDQLYPPDLVEERKVARRVIDGQAHSVMETEQVTRDGHRFPVQLECTVTHDAEGRALQVIAHVHDLTERRKADNELRLAAVAFQSQAAMLVMDARHRIQRVNDAFLALSGYRREDVVGQSEQMLRAGDLDDAYYQNIWAQVDRHGYWRGELWAKVKQGRPKVARVSVSSVTDRAGRILHYVFSMIDLTREQQASADIDRMTFFDRLTDLPNRNFLLGRLKHALQDEPDTVRALVLIDLDHFKRINDLRGHGAGDRLLQRVAQRLQSRLDGEDVLSRFNGGTFALLLQARADGADAGQSLAAECEQLLAALREPFDVAGAAPLMVTASVGWAVLRPGQESAETLLRDVELAMYGAKEAGRDRALEFDPGMREEVMRRETLLRELREALLDGSLDLHLQAQTDRTGMVTGAEMLLRWSRICGERVPPAQFIPLAEDSGLILPLGEWVLRQACEQLVAWSGHPRRRHLSLAVNVSVKQFAMPDFVEGVRRVLAASGADANLLKLEITESVVLGDLDEAANKLRQLRDLGIRVSLDDFGTGYSSLAYLSHLPLDQLKIDQSFVRRLEDDAAEAMVAQTIIGMGHGLDLEVIAEGVETTAQHDFLMIQGCDAFQGYLFARPMGLAAFEQLLDTHPVLP